MGYFDVAGSPDTADRYDLKVFIANFPDCPDIIEGTRKIFDGKSVHFNSLKDIQKHTPERLLPKPGRAYTNEPESHEKSIVVRAVSHHENTYSCTTLFRHSGAERLDAIDTDDSFIKQYDYEIKVSEYWLFDIEERVFKIFRLTDGQYSLQAICHLALCDGQDPIKYFPYAFSFGNVDDKISDILTNDEIDFMLTDIFGYREYPQSEVLDGKEQLMHFQNTNYSMVCQNLGMIFWDYTRNDKRYWSCTHMGVYFSDDDIVIPSFCIVDKQKVTEYYIDGAPSLIAEVARDSVRELIKGYKKTLYAQYGVKEYWVIEPDDKSIEMYLLVDGNYIFNSTYGLATDGNEYYEVATYPELTVKLSEIFKNVIDWENEEL